MLPPNGAELARAEVAEWSYEACEMAYLGLGGMLAACSEEWTRKTNREPTGRDEMIVFESNFIEALSNPYMWDAVRVEVQNRRAAIVGGNVG
jgi:hypothetical protein